MSQSAPSIVIIDYGSGNLRSAEKAFLRQAKGRAVKVSGRPEDVLAADHIILPGVGAFGDCAAGLAAIDGMQAALHQRVIEDGRPFLGICVGLQLMCARGLERGAHVGLGWFDADVVALPIKPENEENGLGLKVPHMGWNTLQAARPHAVLDAAIGADVYFVHSYAAQLNQDTTSLVATVDYGGPVTAALARDNYVGVQFHPEKSQAVGLALIQRFLEWRP